MQFSTTDKAIQEEGTGAIFRKITVSNKSTAAINLFVAVDETIFNKWFITFFKISFYWLLINKKPLSPLI